VSEPLVEGAPLEPEVAPEVEPVWGGPSQDEWGQVTNTLGYLAEYVQSQQAPPAEQQGPVLDPFDDGFGDSLGSLIQQQVREAISPITTWQEQQQASEAENRALDIIEDLVSREGELVGGQDAYPQILAAADRFYAEESARYGAGLKAAESAITRAFKEQKEYEDRIGQSYTERHMNQLGTLSGAPRDVSAPGMPGTQRVVVTPGGDEMDVVTKFFGRR
jgi:hypothetical protein